MKPWQRSIPYLRSCPSLLSSLDPVQVTQMAKYLETVYVSGWQCSSTASSTNEPGPDLAGEAHIQQGGSVLLTPLRLLQTSMSSFTDLSV